MDPDIEPAEADLMDEPVDDNAVEIPGLNLNVNGILGLDLNDEPVNPPELDLNALVDMEEVIIDPLMENPQPNEMFLELNDLLNQVNEEEEDEQEANNDLVNLNEELVNIVNNPADLEVNIPVQNGPAVNVYPLEIQEEDLMNEDEIQQQIQEEAA